MRRPWLDAVMVFTTGIGSFPATLLIAAGTALYLVLQRAWITASAFALMMSFCPFLIFGTKNLFAYARPDYAQQPPDSFAYPSGHAAAMTIIIGFLCITLSRAFKGRQTSRVWGVGVFAILWVAFTRIYLGVHWPTDLLGGFALGAATVAAADLLRRELAKRYREAPIRPAVFCVAIAVIWLLAYLAVVLPNFDDAATAYSALATKQ